MNDSSGNVYFHWDDVKIDEDQTFRVEVYYYVISFTTRYLVNSSIVDDYNTASEIYLKYTKSEELIESNHSKMVSLAQNLTDGLDGWHEKVSKIYGFVDSHMDYETQDEEKGALLALEEGVGDCSEYSYLFVALCRAAGIPARIQAGFAFHRATETLDDGHMWAEYYLENYGWIPVDATWRLFDAIDDKHFSSIQSVPEIASYVNYFFDCNAKEKNMEDEQTVSLAPCSGDVFGNDFVENTLKTIQKIDQAKFAIFLGKVFGTHLIFPSEVKDVEQTFLEGKIQLQNAVESWDEDTATAGSNAVDALEKVQKSLRNAWMLIAKVFMIFVGISIVVTLIALLFLKQHLTGKGKAEVSFT